MWQQVSSDVRMGPISLMGTPPFVMWQQVSSDVRIGPISLMGTPPFVMWRQVSSDVRMLLPLLVGIMVAKWVADALTHPLYHGLLEIKCIPFLNPEPMVSKHLDLLPVARVMASPVVTLCERDRLGTVWEALRHTNHNGFPVVRASAHGQVWNAMALLHAFGNMQLCCGSHLTLKCRVMRVSV